MVYIRQIYWLFSGTDFPYQVRGMQLSWWDVEVNSKGLAGQVGRALGHQCKDQWPVSAWCPYHLEENGSLTICQLKASLAQVVGDFCNTLSVCLPTNPVEIPTLRCSSSSLLSSTFGSYDPMLLCRVSVVQWVVSFISIKKADNNTVR